MANGMAPQDDELLETMKSGGWRNYLSGPAAAALVCAALPLVIGVEVNGLRPVSLVAGGVGALAALIGLVSAARARKGAQAAISAALLLVCLGHVLTGGLLALGFDREAAARALLAQEGISVDTLNPSDEDESYAFTGSRNGSYCMGTVAVTPRTSSHDVVCGMAYPLHILEARCAEGDADACFRASRAYAGDSDAPDAAAMRRLEQRACELGAVSGCFNAGLHLRQEPRTESGLAQGATMWARGCELGHAGACAGYGEALRDGSGAPHDAERAVTFFRRGCEGGAAVGCVNVGSALRLGEGVAVDLEASAASYARACELGDPIGCTNHHENQVLGRGLPVALEPALTELRAQCASGNAYVCSFLGVTLHEGTSELPQDRVAAFALFEAACEAGSRDGCRNAGIYRTQGLGGQTRDRDAARVAFQRACELGDPRSCAQVER